jgi:asparagine synthase (glutamine-hydrolysing)
VLAVRPDGSFAAIEGEIYNRDDLIANLGKDHEAKIDDATIILGLYFLSGPGSLAKLNAAATITIWDADKQLLSIYRDRWGQLSQFYCENQHRLLWASDLRTLLLLGAPREVDAEALDFFLAAGYFPAPWTGLTHIKKLPPAHVLNRHQVGSAEVRSFWQATGKPKLELSVEETTEHLQALLDQSLRRRYESGAKMGVLLSGGVDSALLVGALTRLGADVESFTFHYSEYEGPFNENPLAREIAKHFGIRHHVIEFTPADLADNLHRMVLAYEEPFAYGLHTYFLRDVAQTGTSCAMSGAGVGDWYVSPRDLFARRLRQLPLPFSVIKRVFGSSLSGNGAWSRKVSDVLLGAATGLPGKANAPIATDVVRRALYQEPRHAMGRHHLRSLLRPIVDDCAGETDRDQIVLLTQRYFIAECNLYWYNRWGKAWDIPFRHPYYDNDLQEFAMRLKRYDRDKPEMRRVAARLMPHAIAYAPKLSHTIPIRDWFRGPLLDLIRSRLATDRLKQGGIFAPAAVQRLIDQHVNREADHEWLLWTILTTTVWQDVVLQA